MSDWIRVTKANPCQFCGKDTWCLLSQDGDTAICMRNANEFPKTFVNGEVGYVYRLHERPDARRFNPSKWRPPSAPVHHINAEAMMAIWQRQTTPVMITELACQLGVRASALMELRVAWAPEHSAFAFPMRNGQGAVVGIRLRNSRGDKWAVRGSKSGIFLPYCTPQPACYLCEGPTDTAAALSIGLYAIGRPSCSGGGPDILLSIKRLNIRRLIFVADNDDPGLRGADTLSSMVDIPHCLFTLPCKDMRTAVNKGMDAEVLEAMTKNLRWTTRKEPNE